MPLILTPFIVSFLVLLWTTGAEPSVTAGWSGVALMYFLFLAPSDCVVVQTDSTRCGAATAGILRSCGQQDHWRDNLRRFVPARKRGWWRARGLEAVSSPRNLLTAVGTSVSLTSALFALVNRVI